MTHVRDSLLTRETSSSTQKLRTSIPVEANSAEDIEAAFHLIAEEHVDAVDVLQAPQFGRIRRKIADFALKYRLAREPGSPYDIERDAAADARRAVRWVRLHAADYGVDPNRLGLMGFSAGGELVSMVADNPAPPVPQKADAVDRTSGRPDFQVLIYPGPLGIPARAAAAAPPAFLVAGTLDQCCATPTITLYQQLRTAGVSAELHLFADTDHGFNIGMHSERLGVAHWPDRLADWLADGGWLRAGGGSKPTPGDY